MKYLFYLSLLIIFNFSNFVFAQESGSHLNTEQEGKTEIKELENQRSFRVYGLSSEKDANKLIKGLRDINEVIDCNINSDILYVKSLDKFSSSKIIYTLNKLGFKAVEINNESKKFISEEEKNDIADQKHLNPEQQRALEVYGDRVKLEKIKKEKEKEDKREQVINSKNLPHNFPRYIDTGNPEEDTRKYAELKEKWIKNNPEIYKELFNNSKID
ncbi:MAG: hypothetical protein ABII90_01910 [Bacteroidota bacterium]